MPPRKRKQPSDRDRDAASAGPVPAVASSPAQASSSFLSENDGDLPPFFNTTFSTHRVSPLYVGKQALSQDRLQFLSQRLRDVLVGDVVRGVEVGLDRGSDDGVMARAGVLELVGMGWVNMETLLGRYVNGDGERGGSPVLGSDDNAGSATGGIGKRKALQISLQYENTHCTALLLPSLRSSGPEQQTDAQAWPEPLLDFGASSTDETDADFLQLPLLLLRMPAPLKTVIVQFLSRTFDCRVSALSLGTRSLVRSLERWIHDSSMPAQFTKDTVLTLGFYAPSVTQAGRKKKENTAPTDNEDEARAQDSTMGIKAIDVIIPATDLQRFVKAGRTLESERAQSDVRDLYGPKKRRRLGGDKDEEGWAWQTSKSASGAEETETDRSHPFTEALARYVRHHLALEMFHPAVRITKIACGGFALSEGRMKILGVAPNTEDGQGLSDPQQRAVWGVVGGMMERAQIEPLGQTSKWTA